MAEAGGRRKISGKYAKKKDFKLKLWENEEGKEKFIIFKSYLTQWPQFYLKTKGSLLFASERGHSIIEKTFYSMAAFDFLCFPSSTILEKVLLLSTTANFLFVLRQRYKSSEMRSQIPSQRRRRHKHLCFSPSIPFPSFFFIKNCVKQKSSYSSEQGVTHNLGNGDVIIALPNRRIFCQIPSLLSPSLVPSRAFITGPRFADPGQKNTLALVSFRQSLEKPLLDE